MATLIRAAIAGEVLVDRVVQDLENAVVEAAFVGVADIHPGALADGLEAFEFVDLGGTVGLAGGDVGGAVKFVGFVWHWGEVARVFHRLSPS